ncbi:MAG: hypothetical protein J6K04_04970 [Lachnospiraceae bacterium]|nr:hypothetical protein [Lachnospiraceae bacterium]
MNETERFKQYNLADTVYDYINCYTVEEHDFCGMNFHGNINDADCEYKHFDMSFGKIATPLPAEKINKIQEGVLKNIVVEGNREDGFNVHMEIKNCEGLFVLEFLCASCHIHFLRYRGVDYTNVFGSDRYNEDRKKYLYLEDERYFEDEYEMEVEDGISLLWKNYLHKDGMKCAYMSRYYIQKNGEIVYSYLSLDRHHIPHKKLIYHKNGHRYYPHHVDLYGISYIDVDTLEVFHYIPKGHDTDYDVCCGESFIITGVHYDANTNLVAYEGCYWAGTMDVMVGDLTNPLDFAPELISVHEIIDPEYEKADDVEFYKWKEDSLSVKLDDGEIRNIEIQRLNYAVSM